MRFCACMREISKQSQVSPKARHTRRLLLLKKSCRKELLRFYPGKMPGTAAVHALPPPHAQGHRRCNRCCAAKGKDFFEKLSPNFFWESREILCVHERDIKAKPSVIKSPPHQVPFAPQEGLPQRAAALLPWKNARHCSPAHAATTSRPGTSALQPPLRSCILAPGKIRRCSHVCAAATSRPGTLALQPPLHRCVSKPGKMPGAVAMCSPLPHCACRHWRCSRRCATASRLLAKPRCCSHVCATNTSRPGTSSCCILTPLQPCARHHHIMPGDIGAAAAAALLHLDTRRNARHCSHVRTVTTSRPGTLALQPPMCHCISTPGKTLLRWAKCPEKCPALQ